MTPTTLEPAAEARLQSLLAHVPLYSLSYRLEGDEWTDLFVSWFETGDGKPWKVISTVDNGKELTQLGASTTREGAIQLLRDEGGDLAREAYTTPGVVGEFANHRVPSAVLEMLGHEEEAKVARKYERKAYLFGVLATLAIVFALYALSTRFLRRA